MHHRNVALLAIGKGSKGCSSLLAHWELAAGTKHLRNPICSSLSLLLVRELCPGTGSVFGTLSGLLTGA